MELELIGRVAVVESGILALLTFATTVFVLRRLPPWRCIASALFFAATTYIAASILAISIVLRDGLGPGVVPSHGVTAVTRTAEGLVALLYALPSAFLGYWFARRTPRTEDQPPELAG